MELFDNRFDNSKPYRIAIVAGEASGDALGAGLMRALKERLPHVSFMGIGGEKMRSEALHSFFNMERLAVMGVSEPLLRLPELWRMRQFIIKTFSQNPPDLYIGIDAPDFNLGIARILKARGIKTLHYVSPTIWAWRAGRLKKIVQALNHILLIFPFEADIYQPTALNYDYVGHPLADELEFKSDKKLARSELDITSDLNSEIIAILPGSRESEIKFIIHSFVKTAQLLFEKNPHRIFIAAMLNQEKADLFQRLLAKIDHTVPILIKINQTRKVLEACDVAMVVSGTATLETALMKRPFIVGYKMSAWQYHIAKYLIKTRYIAMPNIIANQLLVTEYIQNNLDPIKMAQSLEELLQSPDGNQSLIREFETMHQLLKQNSNQKAAEAVLRLLETK